MKQALTTLALLGAVALLALAAGAEDGSSVPRLPAPMRDVELGVPIGPRLESLAVEKPLIMDGVVEPAWEAALPLAVPLHYGLHGSERAGTVELRSAHDATQVYFLVSWSADVPGGEADAWHNLMTVHWRLVDAGEVSGESTGSEGLACTVGCHTVTADGQGNLVGIRTETIPPGLSEDLPAGGGWSPGQWLLEWSRSRESENPYDQDLVDPEAAYRFFVKLFLGLEDKPDPVSDVLELRLSR